MSRNMNPITVCCAAVLMLGLAACGSDDDDGSTMMTETPTPVAVDLSGVAAGATAGMAEIAAGATGNIGDIAFTCAAGGDACSVTVDAEGDATATGGVVTAANSAAYTKRTTDAAVTKEMAIGVEAEQAADANDGPGGMDAATDHSIEIEHDGTGATVTIEVAGAAAAAPKFERAEVMLDGGRSMHVRAMEADDDGNVVEEVMIVATDIEAPKEEPFAEVHTLTANPNEATPPVNQSLPIVADNLAMMETDGISATGGGTLMLDAAVEDDATTMDVDETVAAFETDATFDGAPGTLTCGGDTDCTVTLDADGDITAVTGGWIFTPDADAEALVADADYLHYGVWLKKTTDEDGAVTYNEVETFAGSSVDPSGSLATVTGTASYEGGAVGVYVMKHGYSQTTGELDDATSGHFKARAYLEATFAQVDNMDGEGTIAESMLDSITGTIDQFELSGGEANAWAVELDGDIVPATGTVVDGITSDVAENGDDGTFTGTFHGSTTDEDGTATVQPSSVVGEFNANFRNGAVAGAFGARKLPESE